MRRMRRMVSQSRNDIREGIRLARNLDFYEMEGHFVSEYTLQVGSERIRGEKIFLVSGARPLIPPIKGIDEVEYLTNESVLELDECWLEQCCCCCSWRGFRRSPSAWQGNVASETTA